MNKISPKAKQLYDEAELAFREYADSCVWDMLDNYYDFLLACDDDFLDLFYITYHTEIETEKDENENDYTSYVSPEIVLTPKAPHKFEPLYVMVVGFVLPRNVFYNGFGIQCDVIKDNQEQGRQCVKMMKELLGV